MSLFGLLRTVRDIQLVELQAFTPCHVTKSLQRVKGTTKNQSSLTKCSRMRRDFVMQCWLLHWQQQHYAVSIIQADGCMPL